jgi:hypothetical protein
MKYAKEKAEYNAIDLTFTTLRDSTKTSLLSELTETTYPA